MKNRYIWSLALAAAALSCQKETLDSDVVSDSGGGIPVEFALTSPSQSTRVTIDDLEIAWETGDKMLFYNGTSLSSDATSYATLTVDEIEDNVVTFSGNLPAALGGGNVSGFYPASGVFLNNGSLDAYSQLRIVQPGYIKYDYENGKITPESMAEYCYLTVCSDEMLFTTEETPASFLGGTASYVLAYMDLNLKNPKGKVDKVYISLSEPLTYESVKVNSSATIGLDKRLDYCESSTGDSEFDDYLSFQMNYLVVEMNDGAGAAANDETSEVQMRIPLIPQTLFGTWTVLVEYTDEDTQDMFTVNMTGVTMDRGVVYSHGKSYDLDNATSYTGADKLPKMGDLVDQDGAHSTTTNNIDTAVGVVYDIKGVGAELAVASAYRLTTTSYKALNTAYVNDTTNSSSRNAHFTGVHKISNGFDLMQAYIDIVNDESLDEDTTYSNPLAALRDQGYTNDEILSKISPAYSAAWAQNTHTVDRPESPYTGEERGWWYLPSLGEVYHLIYQTQMLQSHGTYFFSERESEISGETTILPTATGVTNILTGATWETTAGGVWGVVYAKNYRITNLTPAAEPTTDSAMSSLSYISTGCNKNITGTGYPMRTIINY